MDQVFGGGMPFLMGQTHRHGGTLDHVWTRSDETVINLTVDPPDMISDHSLVTWQIPFLRQRLTVVNKSIRSWKKVDRRLFRQSIIDSELFDLSSGNDADSMFATYDRVLRELSNKFAPHTKRRFVSIRLLSGTMTSRACCEGNPGHWSVDIGELIWLLIGCSGFSKKKFDIKPTSSKKTVTGCADCRRMLVNPGSSGKYSRLWWDWIELLIRRSVARLHKISWIISYWKSKPSVCLLGVASLLRDWSRPLWNSACSGPWAPMRYGLQSCRQNQNRVRWIRYQLPSSRNFCRNCCHLLQKCATNHSLRVGCQYPSDTQSSLRSSKRQGWMPTMWRATVRYRTWRTCPNRSSVGLPTTVDILWSSQFDSSTPVGLPCTALYRDDSPEGHVWHFRCCWSR